jgi:hypothetical protein
MIRESMAGAFLLLLHDEFSGRRRCGAEPLRGGLVGAQLAELLIAGRVGVAEGRVHPLDADRLDNARPAAEYVMECVRSQPRRYTVRTWTENLGEPLHQMIVTELVDDGVVRREVGGLGWRRTVRLPALDLLRAAAPRARIERMITAPHELNLAGAFTIAMLWELGIEEVMDIRAKRGGAELVQRIRTRMPAPLCELLDGIGDSAAASSVAVRR